MASSSTPTTFSTPQFLHQQVRSNNKLWTLSKVNNFNGNMKPHDCYIHKSRFQHLSPINATLKGPKGFGASSNKKKKKTKNPRKEDYGDNEEEEEYQEEEEREQGVIPEVVTNRMISRMGFSVGIPLGIGLLFFPFFYYLKVGLKIDVPTWVPFIVSFFFFGSALLGVSYGIVSSSWDPLREGSLLGWNEAQKNWPVFWQSLKGGGGEGSRKN
ncbi:protein PAM68, chloroplastic [Arachis stenosperma]|uniref:protein PAM68, chloroplastic n=1 Tax=Arachis stenosperma TaxID=217475 RepID=UPI0025AD032F|nr:protein PAM68, chloroplastic [Arachis stenosperma]